MWRLVIALALGAAFGPVAAETEEAAKEEVVAALSQNRIAITANFDGSEIFVFGAIKRQSPPPDEPLGVVITVAGPLEPTIVRRKERVFGIWANVDAVEVDAAPTFYAVASSGPISEILTNLDDLRYKIRIEQMIKSVGAPMHVEDAQAFPEAVVRIRKRQGLYIEIPETVEIRDETLFGTHVALPANLVEGEYTATIYVTRDRQVVDKESITIDVHKVGLERLIYALAHEQPLLYGFLAVLLAAMTGWVASIAFGRLR